jgi:hypothetical protein
MTFSTGLQPMSVGPAPQLTLELVVDGVVQAQYQITIGDARSAGFTWVTSALLPGKHRAEVEWGGTTPSQPQICTTGPLSMTLAHP